ncbi:hypothetical protein BTIS_1120 [Bifidobacterium tissieri]|uniref:Uncharacterized protein n=1 Tax=Bifidobacterium tissieri TaxID=1630162 RepID=A0A261FFF7_9BIFI|nr:hypothetical protein [Bifidobacterium tissieri]OZG57879.1 hypothetical protein BTIS_1120 [Bifidobacterium tissieri]
MITSAEMKCLRESMGLSTKWLAIHWDVAESSVKRWEHTRLLPAGLEMDLCALKKRFDAEVDRLASQSGESALLVPRVEIESTQGMPASWHRAIAQRASEINGARILFVGDEQL